MPKVIENRLSIFGELLSHIETLRSELRKISRGKRLGQKEVFEVLNQVDSILKNVELPQSFDVQFSDSINSLTDLRQTQPERFENNQAPERFEALANDSVSIKSLKIGKRWLYNSQLGWVKISNTLRSWAKKEPQNLPIWHHTIPFQNIVAHQNQILWEQLFKGISSDYVRLIKTFDQISQLYEIVYEHLGKPVLSSSEATINWNLLTNEVLSLCSKTLDTLYSETKQAELSIEKETKDLVENYLNIIQFKSEIVDTIEQSESSYEPEKTEVRRKKVRKNFEKFYSKWNEFKPLKKNQWLVTKQAVEQLFYQNEIADKFVSLIHSQIQTEIIENLKSTHSILEKDQEYFQELTSVNEESIESKRVELATLIKELISEKSNLESSEKWIKDSFVAFKDEFLATMGDEGEPITLAIDSKFGHGIPEFSSYSLQWRDQIGALVSKELDKIGRIVPEDYLEHIALLNELSQEFDQVIDVSITAAIEAQEYDESGIEIILDSLERIQDRLERSVEKSQEVSSDLSKIIRSSFSNVATSVLEMVFSGTINSLTWKERENLVRETALDWTTVLTVWQAKFIDATTVWFRFSSIWIGRRWESLRELLGMTASKSSGGLIEADISQFLSESRRQNSELPFVYRRLFSLGNIEEQRVYVRPKGADETINKAFRSWESGNKVDVAIIGEPGAGKSFFLNQALKNLGSSTTRKKILAIGNTTTDAQSLIKMISRKMGHKTTSDAKELINAIKKSKKREVFAIENLHQLFMRSPTGFAALETLLLLINETRSEVFWILTGSRFAWQYINNVIRIREYFTFVIEIDKIDREQVQEMILLRHKLSGFELEFEATADMKRQRSYKKMLNDPEKLQQYVRKKFFDDLTQFAEGNATTAILFWLISIKDINENRVLICSQIDQFDGLTSGLSTDVLFTYTALLIHDSLTTEEHAKVFNQSERVSTLLLSRMHASGLIDNYEGAYQINDLILRPLIRALKLRNMIH